MSSVSLTEDAAAMKSSQPARFRAADDVACPLQSRDSAAFEHVAALRAASGEGGPIMRTRSLLAVAVVVLAVAAPAQAQPRGGGDTTNSFEFRLGGFFPAGGGEFWDGTESTFDLSHSDFNDAMLGISYVAGITNNFELGFNLGFYDSTVRAGYRDFVDQDGFPILHDTTLRLTPLTVDFRFLPGGRYSLRGRRGQYRVHHPVPYVGAGAGMNFWSYRETGDFLDFSQSPPVVFPASFRDSGTAFEGHVLAGVELPVGPAWGVLFEGRYSWSSVTPGGDFAGLGKLNLGGPSAFIGASLHF